MGDDRLPALLHRGADHFLHALLVGEAMAPLAQALEGRVEFVHVPDAAAAQGRRAAVSAVRAAVWAADPPVLPGSRAAWDDLSSKAMIGGAALAVGIGAATKAAIDWDSAWAGVEKTVDGTPEQMAETVACYVDAA